MSNPSPDLSLGRCIPDNSSDHGGGAGPRPFSHLPHPHSAGDLYQRLMDANVITDLRGDRLRFGFGLYQDPEDVDKLCELRGTHPGLIAR